MDTNARSVYMGIEPLWSGDWFFKYALFFFRTALFKTHIC